MRNTDSRTNPKQYVEDIYFAFLAIMLGAKAMGIDDGNLFYRVIFTTAILLFLLKVAVTEHTVYELLGISAFMILAVAIWRVTGEKGLILCFAMMLGIKGADVRRVFKLSAVILGTMMTINILITLCGLKYDALQYGRWGVRHSLGYPHPNTLQLTCFVFVTMIMYLAQYRNKKQILQLSILLLMISLYIYVYSQSRTGIALTVFFLILNYILNCRKSLSVIEKIVFLMVYPICAIGSVAVVIFSSDETIKWIELHMDTIGVRISVARYFYLQNSLSLLGSRIIISPGSEGYGIDMAYCYLLFELGIIAFVVMGVLYTVFIYYCLHNNMRTELAITISMVLIGVLEPFLFNLSFKNFSLLFIGMFLYKMSSVLEMKYCESSSRLFCKVVLLRIQKIHTAIYMLDQHCRNLFNNIKMLLCIINNAKRRKEIIVFTVVSVIVCICFSCMIKKPELLFTDLPTESVTYLSKAEEMQLRKAGNIFINYTDESAPVYMSDTYAAYCEYYKKMISTGIWAGFISAIVYAFKDVSINKEKCIK
jgi:hypothetical protein